MTGDEPQGTMGRVQTAGEAPARSCVVFLAKESFSWHGPIFGLFKSWKRSLNMCAVFFIIVNISLFQMAINLLTQLTHMYSSNSVLPLYVS